MLTINKTVSKMLTSWLCQMEFTSIFIYLHTRHDKLPPGWPVLVDVGVVGSPMVHFNFFVGLAKLTAKVYFRRNVPATLPIDHKIWPK